MNSLELHETKSGYVQNFITYTGQNTILKKSQKMSHMTQK
jgi:hypothetical protein